MALSLIPNSNMNPFKKIWLLPIFVFFACKSATDVTDFSVQESLKISEENIEENCFNTLELIPNSALAIKEDPFGIAYPVISKGNSLLLKYTYKKKTNPNLQDASYSEIIYAELKSPLQDLVLKNENLSSIKLYFGRLCFCPGETGYYPITSGQFSLKVIDEKHLEIMLNFKIVEVPHLLSHISEVIVKNE